MDNKLNKNLQDELNGLEGELNDEMFNTELKKLRKHVTENNPLYEEQLNYLVDILEIAKKLSDANGKILNTLKDEVEEVKNLTVQETIFDILACVENSIKTMVIPRQVVEKSIEEMGIPARELAFKLAVNLLIKTTDI